MTTTQTTEVEQLNPLSFPLHGSRLIEASAGTGKPSPWPCSMCVLF